jgi:hypothetical protein
MHAWDDEEYEWNEWVADKLEDFEDVGNGFYTAECMAPLTIRRLIAACAGRADRDTGGSMIDRFDHDDAVGIMIEEDARIDAFSRVCVEMVEIAARGDHRKIYKCSQLYFIRTGDSGFTMEVKFNLVENLGVWSHGPVLTTPAGCIPSDLMSLYR